MSVLAKPDHEVFYQDLIALIRKHESNMGSLEMLAVAANMLGKLVAMQDQRTVTVEHAMKVVQLNIEYGNQQVIALMSKSGGTA